MLGALQCETLITITYMTLSFVQCVLCHCSEAHRQTCSLSYLQLQQISTNVSPTTKYMPDYNETTLHHVCGYYTSYRDCSQPFLSACNQDTIIELQTYDVTLGLICGNLSKDYLEHRSCLQRLQKAHTSCKDKEINSMTNVDTTRNAYNYVLCSSAKEYVLCIYSSTALGCSIQAAELLFQLLNQSIRMVFKSNMHNCDVRHPMDVISIYTTTTTSTTQSTQSDVTTRTKQETHGSFVRTSESSMVFRYSEIVIILCISFTTVYLDVITKAMQLNFGYSNIDHKKS